MLDLSTYAPFYDRHRFHALARAARAALQACGDPDDVAELWVMLGDAAFRLGHFDDARAHYARAFELRGDPPGAELPERWASAFERWRTEPADGTPGDPERADAIRDRMSATGERYAEAYAFVNGSREVSSMAGWLVTTSHESDSLDELRGFTAYVDPDVRCDGAPCAAFHPISPNTRFGGVLMQELDASGYRGRRVAISAWVRADAPSTRARLFVTRQPTRVNVENIDKA